MSDIATHNNILYNKAVYQHWNLYKHPRFALKAMHTWQVHSTCGLVQVKYKMNSRVEVSAHAVINYSQSISHNSSDFVTQPCTINYNNAQSNYSGSYPCRDNMQVSVAIDLLLYFLPCEDPVVKSPNHTKTCSSPSSCSFLFPFFLTSSSSCTISHGQNNSWLYLHTVT